jgi:MSHA biogenesis protein MshJ
MMAQLQTLMDRMDALSLRERLFLCLSVLVCVLALADFVWFTPAQSAHKLQQQRFANQGAELDRLRTELALAALPNDSGRAAREELQAVNKRLEELNTEIKSMVPADSKGPPIEQVLQRLLLRQEGLTLLSLDTLPAEAASAAGGVLPAGMARRGVQLRVAGPYAALVRYVQALEVALPGLRWGSMELKADQRSSELSLLVYALGVQP